MKFGKYTVDISNEDKIFFPEIEASKGDLITYYEFVQSLLLPFVEDRIITMQRFPDGIDHNGFFQKEASDYFPDWLKTIEIETKGGKSQETPTIDNQASLVYLANQGAITFHRWLSTSEDLDKPNIMVFDLDPSEKDIKTLVDAAFIIKDFLEEDLDLSVYLLSTGSRGVHIVIPLQGNASFDVVRDVSKDIAHLIEEQNPKIFTTKTRKDQREGKIFVDYLRNAFGQTVVVPYSVRALKNGPIAVPIDWNDLDKSFDPQAVNLSNYKSKIDPEKTPWKGMKRHARSIKSIQEDIEKIKS